MLIALSNGAVIVDGDVVNEEYVDRVDAEPLEQILERPHHSVVAAVGEKIGSFARQRHEVDHHAIKVIRHSARRAFALSRRERLHDSHVLGMGSGVAFRRGEKSRTRSSKRALSAAVFTFGKPRALRGCRETRDRAGGSPARHPPQTPISGSGDCD